MSEQYQPDEPEAATATEPDQVDRGRADDRRDVDEPTALAEAERRRRARRRRPPTPTSRPRSPTRPTSPPTSPPTSLPTRPPTSRRAERRRRGQPRPTSQLDRASRPPTRLPPTRPSPTRTRRGRPTRPPTTSPPPTTRSRRSAASCGPSRATGSWCTPTPAWRTGSSANLENRISSLNMEDYIHEIVVPTEEVAEIKNGQRKMVKRTVLPGYVLVRMDLTDESWAAVRHTPSVTGFVGHSHQPVPLSMAEVENMLAPAVVATAEAAAAAAERYVDRWRRQEARRGRRLLRVRLRHGGRRSVRHAARDHHRDQRRVPAGQGAGRDLRPGDPGRAELQPDSARSERHRRVSRPRSRARRTHASTSKAQ